eukprot:TRINITY_DN4282_c0_g1_i1.p1 TRINITY_DN4282_c0_g1~~TRINITY_DN4282_c0_g1_i1.p1  ORF type:complete len:1211 (+),score=624.80 TRINITY_DN4282_c0_g1_i1:123-3755(+)
MPPIRRAKSEVQPPPSSNRSHPSSPATIQVSSGSFDEEDSFDEVDLGSSKGLRRDNSAPSLVLSPSKWLKFGSKEESSEGLLSEDEDYNNGSPRHGRSRSQSNKKEQTTNYNPRTSTSASLAGMLRNGLANLRDTSSRSSLVNSAEASSKPIRKLSFDDKKMALAGTIPNYSDGSVIQIQPNQQQNSSQSNRPPSNSAPGFIYIASPRDNSTSPATSYVNTSGTTTGSKKGWTEKDYLRRIRNLEEELRMGESFKRALRETMQSQVEFLKMESDLDKEKLKRLEGELSSRKREEENRLMLKKEWNNSEEDLVFSNGAPSPLIPLNFGDDDKRAVWMVESSPHQVSFSEKVILKQEAMVKRLKKRIAIEKQKLDLVERSRQDRDKFMKKLEESINQSIAQLKEEKIFLSQLTEEKIFMDQLSYLPASNQVKSFSSETIKNRTPEEQKVAKQLQEVNEKLMQLERSSTVLSERIMTEQRELVTMQEQTKSAEMESSQKSAAIQANIVISEEALKSIDSLLTEVKTLNESINNMNNQAVELRSQIEKLKSELNQSNEFGTKLEEKLRSQSKQMEENIQKFEEMNQKSETQIQSLNRQIAALTSRLNDEQQRVENLKGNLLEEKENFKKMEENLNSSIKNLEENAEKNRISFENEKKERDEKIILLEKDSVALSELVIQHAALKVVHEEENAKLSALQETELINIQLKTELDRIAVQLSEERERSENSIASLKAEKVSLSESITSLKDQLEESNNAAQFSLIESENEKNRLKLQLETMEKSIEAERENVEIAKKELGLVQHKLDQVSRVGIETETTKNSIANQLKESIESSKRLNEQLALNREEFRIEKERINEEVTELKVALEEAKMESLSKSRRLEENAQLLNEIKLEKEKEKENNSENNNQMIQEKETMIQVLNQQLEQLRISLESEKLNARNAKSELVEVNLRFKEAEQNALNLSETLATAPSSSDLNAIRSKCQELEEKLTNLEAEKQKSERILRDELELTKQKASVPLSYNEAEMIQTRKEYKQLRVDLRSAFDELKKEREIKAEIESQLISRNAELEVLQTSLKDLQERSSNYYENLVIELRQKHESQVTELESKLKEITNEILSPKVERDPHREAELRQKLESEGHLVKTLRLVVNELTEERDKLLKKTMKKDLDENGFVKHLDVTPTSSPAKLSMKNYYNNGKEEEPQEKELQELREWKAQTEGL